MLNNDMVVVQNYEQNKSYFKVDRNGTVLVGEGLQVGATGGDSTTFLGGTLEVDGKSMFGNDIKLYSTTTQSIEHQGTNANDKLHINSKNGKVQIEKIEIDERDINGVSSLKINVNNPSSVGINVKRALAIG